MKEGQYTARNLLAGDFVPAYNKFVQTTFGDGELVYVLWGDFTWAAFEYDMKLEVRKGP